MSIFNDPLRLLKEAVLFAGREKLEKQIAAALQNHVSKKGEEKIADELEAAATGLRQGETDAAAMAIVELIVGIT